MRRVLVPLMALAACTSSSVTTTTDTGNTTTPPTTATSVAAPPTTGAPLDAEVVLHNGTVITMDAASTITTGLAISDGRIVAVGDGEQMLAQAPTALGVDLEGRTVIPGIIDPHIHLVQNQSGNPEAMRAEEQVLIQTGRTTVGVPAVIPFNLDAFQALADSGELMLRTHLYLSVNDACGEPVETEGWWRDYQFDRSPEQRLAIAGIKLFADGGSCNAPAFSFTWIDGTNGDLYVDSATVADILGQADEEGALTVVHAIGDRAVDAVLTGFETALAGNNPNRHRIDHNSMVQEEWVSRYGSSGANFVGWARIDSCLEQAGMGWETLGEEHLPWLRTHAAVKEASPDITVAWHSDAPHTPSNIWESVLGLTTFISLGADGQHCLPPPWLDDKKVSVETALRMMTIDAAAVMDLDTALGSIEVGKIADLAIVRLNPLTLEGLAHLDNRVDSTWIDGRSVWCDGWSACDLLIGELLDLQGLTVTASASREGHGPAMALDGKISGESFWSSGEIPPGWIQVEFDQPRPVAGLRFTVFQNPPSDTAHSLEIRVDGVWAEVERFAGFTTTGDILEWLPDAAVEGVDAFRMTTLESESWPEWYEIEILD